MKRVLRHWLMTSEREGQSAQAKSTGLINSVDHFCSVVQTPYRIALNLYRLNTQIYYRDLIQKLYGGLELPESILDEL